MADLTRVSDSPDLLITHATYNADDTVATRTDVLGVAGSDALQAVFGYDRLGRLISAASPLYTGSATYVVMIT